MSCGGKGGGADCGGGSIILDAESCQGNEEKTDKYRTQRMHSTGIISGDHVSMPM